MSDHDLLESSGIRAMIACVISLVGYYIYTTKKASKRPPLPPGPKPWPLVGNITDLLPAGAREWEFWLEHKEKYGPISSVTALGSTIVVINSLDLAYELMEKRSAIYSGRPMPVFGAEMCGYGGFVSFQNEHLRDHRRRLYDVIGTQKRVAKFGGIQDSESHKLLLRILDEPDHLVEHIRTKVGAGILKLTYGYTVETSEPDPLVDLAERTMDSFSVSVIPGVWLVDVMPILRYLPEWMPGAGFKKTAREFKATLTELVEKPLRFAKKQMANKQHSPSYVSELYEKDDDEFTIKWTAATLYAAGADTSVGLIAIFFLGMMIHPEVQRKAQEEIDRVVGRSRLPTPEDRKNLPYVEAVFKESFRWHTLTPTALAHLCTQDDICEGYLIPKGAIIVPNVWWFAHDPTMYPNPEVFDPSRFLGPNPAPDPLDYAFGFGRRVCPGKQLATYSIWLDVARCLAVFDISRGRDEKGNEIEPEIKFTSGVVSHPVPYSATIKPRSEEHEYLIRQVEVLHPQEKSSVDELESVAF